MRKEYDFSKAKRSPYAKRLKQSVTALESCIAAKVLVEGMKRSGRDVTRASLHRSLSALGRFDAGGYVVDFKPNFRHGGSYVGMALLRPNGEVRD